jgi:hypothetical protein
VPKHQARSLPSASGTKNSAKLRMMKFEIC